MSNIVQFKRPEKTDPHLSGEATCIGCRHTWVAVAPVGVRWLECPNCAAMKGIFRHPIGADAGDFEFRCLCGCEALTAYQHQGRFYLRCMGCGTEQTQAVFG